MAEKDKVLSHSYDGIEEYDNDLPRWWIQIFWITTVLAIGYIIFQHSGFTETPQEKLARQMEEIQAIRAQHEVVAPAADTQTALLAVAKDSGALEKGKAIFSAKCAVCHLEQGQGLVGPNLTDDYWIHGGKITDIHTIIVNGVLEKGMLAWKDQLSSEEIFQVTAYVWVLHGTNPPNPKEPQGELVPREQVAGE